MKGVAYLGNGRKPMLASSFLLLTPLLSPSIVAHVSTHSTLLEMLGLISSTEGKNPDEVNGAMKQKAKLDEIARQMKLEIVDAELPVEEIIEILKTAKQ